MKSELWCCRDFLTILPSWKLDCERSLGELKVKLRRDLGAMRLGTYKTPHVLEPQSLNDSIFNQHQPVGPWCRGREGSGQQGLMDCRMCDWAMNRKTWGPIRPRRLDRSIDFSSPSIVEPPFIITLLGIPLDIMDLVIMSNIREKGMDRG
jgi:hypothetical protein